MNDSRLASMSDRRRMILFALMAVGQFMALLDTQIVAASISDIQAGLAAAPDESSWIQTAYLMAEIVMIPLSGWLSRAFSTRWLFTASAAGFTVASAVCGCAWNIQSMIVARAIQGFVGGAMIPTVFATGYALFTGKKRAIIPATLGLLSSFAPTIGPTLGGWITDTFSWHWLFFINIVPGIVLVCTVPFFEPIDDPDPSLLARFDYLGLVLLAVSLGSLEYVLEEGYRWNWLEDPTIRNLAWTAAATSALFLWRCLVHPSPIVDLGVLKSRTFALACVLIFVTGFGLFGGVYVLPLFLARVAGYDARQIGEAVFVAGLSQIAAAPLVARLSQRMDPRVMVTIGFSIYAFGLWRNTPVTSQWTGGEFFWPQVLRGAALLMCIVPATNMALGALPPGQLKMASALFNTLRNLGGAVGIAWINTSINDRTNKHWSDLASGLTAANPRLQTWIEGAQRQVGPLAADPGATSRRALAILADTVRREAVTMAFSDTFYVMTLLFVGALVLVPFLRPAVPSPAVREAVH